MKNPLIRRIPRELKGDWHKYLVIIVFMVIMIGVISGMYVGHDSMLAAVYAGRDELDLEDGSFELSKKASQALLDDISSGKKADVRSYYIDKGNKEADKKVAEAIEDELNEQVTEKIEEAVRAQCAAYGITDEEMIKAQIDAAMESSFDKAIEEAKESDEYKKAVDEAYDKAHEEVVKKVDEEWDEVADRYNLNDEIDPVTVKIYEHFYRNESEDNNGDGVEDATVRVYKSDSEIDKASFNEGRAPEADDEIAIDRMTT